MGTEEEFEDDNIFTLIYKPCPLVFVSNTDQRVLRDTPLVCIIVYVFRPCKCGIKIIFDTLTPHNQTLTASEVRHIYENVSI